MGIAGGCTGTATANKNGAAPVYGITQPDREASDATDFGTDGLQSGVSERDVSESDISEAAASEATALPWKFELSDIPAYAGNPYVELNQNQPLFQDSDFTTEAFEIYSDLDGLGRCGTAYANICQEIMPTEERGPIGTVQPSGWHTEKYNDLIDGNYLYNRCHLIAYSLAGENANERNLITGTRYLNVQGMLPFENTVAAYAEETGNHVLYRVTPVFEGENLVASGVVMEAESVEDRGAGICFHVFVYNVQPGIRIDYATGSSEREPNYAGNEADADNEADTENEADADNEADTENETDADNEADADTGADMAVDTDAGGGVTYILNTNTHKFHDPDCPSVADMADKNKKETTESREQIIAEGYEPCKRCHP